MEVDDVNPYFLVLGLTPTATREEVRKAYLMMSLLCHPDKCKDKDPGAIDQKTKEFQQLREAYDELQKFLGADDVFEESGSEGKTDLILTLLSLTVFSSLKWALFLK